MAKYPIYEETLTDTIDVDANTSKTETIDIPQDKDIQRIYVRLSGTVTGTLSAWKEDNPMSLIPNLTLKGGKDTIFDISMATLWQLNCYDFGIVPERTVVTTNTSPSTFNATVVYSFMKNARNPLDVSRVLPARDYPNLQLKVKIGSATDICTGATLGSGCQVDVKLTQTDPNPLNLKFLDREINTKRIPLFEAAWNILICEYEHDIYYRRRLDWLVGKINEYGWEALDGPPDSYPHEHCWKSEEPKEPNWKELMEERSNAISSRRSE